MNEPDPVALMLRDSASAIVMFAKLMPVVSPGNMRTPPADPNETLVKGPKAKIPCEIEKYSDSRCTSPDLTVITSGPLTRRMIKKIGSFSFATTSPSGPMMGAAEENWAPRPSTRADATAVRVTVRMMVLRVAGIEGSLVWVRPFGLSVGHDVMHRPAPEFASCGRSRGCAGGAHPSG